MHESINRKLTAFCASRLGRAINRTSMFGVVVGGVTSGALMWAMLFGHASATEFGLCLIATGGLAFVYVLTE